MTKQQRKPKQRKPKQLELFGELPTDKKETTRENGLRVAVLVSNEGETKGEKS